MKLDWYSPQEKLDEYRKAVQRVSVWNDGDVTIHQHTGSALSVSVSAMETVPMHYYQCSEYVRARVVQ